MIENTHPLYKMNQKKTRYSKYYDAFFLNSAGWGFHHIAGMPTIFICSKNMLLFFLREFSTFFKPKNENSIYEMRQNKGSRNSNIKLIFVIYTDRFSMFGSEKQNWIELPSAELILWGVANKSNQNIIKISFSKRANNCFE